MADNKLKEITPQTHPSGGKQLTMMAMAIMIVTTIVSMRGLASQAEFGLTSIFYLLLSDKTF